ncbi:hypothetical protein PR003_g9785 [Phytophthora rubi]|uniref:Uncharacterized protein n=1 Tax=Phytophthora rubi TaxID=129364 RepID=A0A6A3MYQ5_9STRA|nr:hypothetical protein PR002_g9661 [Phytophthora rubi]KAE9034327.1 hypothetical protein PR001_g9775 [Phytophthora rubi]KAE9341820.1 hypothetical protein PR003_g9785 [Phytophthora rubi]
MNAPSWSGPKVSRLWSAKGDERCSPPRSDDYKDWSLSQLKREITQRQLKTNPRRRNKDAFVRVLLSHDQQQTQQQTLEPPVEEPVLFVPTSTSELQSIYVNSGDQQQQQQQVQVQDIYGNNTTQDMYRSDAQPQDVYRDNAGQQPHQPQPQSQEIYVDQQQQQDVYGSSAEQQQQQQQIFASVGMMQPAPLTPPPTSMPQLQAQVQTQTQTPVTVEAMAAVPAPAPVPVSVATEAEVETPQSFQSTVKRQRLAGVRQDNEGSEHVNGATSEARPGSSTCTQQVAKGSTEYLRRKLGIQAARLEIESRRLDLENKREQRHSELHAVQLALAQEQLQQAKMTTQKMKTEWMVEQMIQKKRLNDAGISQEDSATLGMYLS